jgi:hypothetical protein
VWEPSTGTSHRLPKTGIHGNLVYRVVSWIPAEVGRGFNEVDMDVLETG